MTTTTSQDLTLQQIANQTGKISESQQLAEANKYLATHPSSVQSGLNSAENTVTAPFKIAASVTTFLTSGKNWIRMLEVVAGVILVVMGLHQLTGVGSGAGTVVKTAAKVGR